MTKAFNLQGHGITVAEIHRNLPPSVLYEHAIRYEKDAGWDPKYRIKVRVICSRPYHALFMHRLVNTGWSGGAYGTGKRIKLANTRAIVDAIHSGALVTAKTQRDPVFGFDVVTECPNVPAEILIPRNLWADKEAFDATAKKLAGLFIKNFAAYEGGVSAEVKAGGPVATV